MVVVHFPGKFRVADYVPAAIEDEEVRTSDDNDRTSADCEGVLEFRLIDYGNAITDGFQGSRHPLASLSETDVFISSQRGEVAFLVNLAECLDYLVEGTWLRFLDSLFTQI
jgi:hypothetical protein